MNITPNNNASNLKLPNPDTPSVLQPIARIQVGGINNNYVQTHMWTGQGLAPIDSSRTEPTMWTQPPQPPTPTKTEKELACAIEKNNYKRVRALVNKNVNLHAVELLLLPSRRLWGVCALGKTEGLRCLLAAGFNPRAQKNGSSPLAIAIRAGHYEIVTHLLKSLGEDFCLWSFLASQGMHREASSLINAGFTPSKEVLETIDPNWATQLIENISNRENITPFEYVCNMGLKGYINRFMDRNFGPLVIQLMKSPNNAAYGYLLQDPLLNIHETEQNGETALHLAVRSDNVDLVKILLQQGAVVERYDGRGRSPYAELKPVPNPEIKKLLDDHRNMPTNLIDLAKNKKWPEIVSVLKQTDRPFASFPEATELLILAVEQGNGNAVAGLVLLGVNIHAQNSRGQSALATALKYGHTEIFQYLANQGATFVKWSKDICWRTICDPKMIDHFLFILDKLDQMVVQEVHKSFLKSVTELMDRPYLEGMGLILAKIPETIAANWWDSGFDQLFMAGAAEENCTVMQACARYVSSPEGTMHLLIDEGYYSLDAVKILLQAGLDLSSFDSQATFRILQAAFDKPELLKLLLDNKANPNAFNEGKFSILGQAISSEKEEAAKILLDSGADPTCNLGTHYWTPLAKALSLEWDEVCEKLIQAGASCEGPHWNHPQTPLAQKCLLLLKERFDQYEATLRERLGNSYLSSDDEPMYTHPMDYFVKRTGDLQLTLYMQNAAPRRVGMGKEPFDEIKTARYTNSLVWLYNAYRSTPLQMAENGQMILAAHLQTGLTDTYWNDLPIFLEPDHEHRQVYLCYLNPVDLSVVKELKKLDEIQFLPEHVKEVQKRVREEVIDLLHQAYLLVDQRKPFLLTTTNTGFILSYPCAPSLDSSGELSASIRGYSLHQLQKELDRLPRTVMVSEELLEIKKNYPWLSVTANDCWTEFTILTDWPRFEIKDLTWDEVKETLPLLDIARTALSDLIWDHGRWGAVRLSTTEPTPKPKPGLQLDWYKRELYRLQKHRDLADCSYMLLAAGLDQYLNVVANCKGAPGVPDNDISIYEQIRTNTLLTLEKLQTADDDRRASVLRAFAEVGLYCGPKMRDVSKEQYEIVTGRVERSFAEGSMEQFENEVLNTWLQALVAKMLPLVTNEEAKQQTSHLEHYLYLILHQEFQVAFSDEDMSKLRDPFIVRYGTMGFCQNPPEDLDWILGLGDDNPDKRKVLTNAWNFAREELKNKIYDTLYETYENSIRTEMAKNGQLVKRIRERLLVFIEEHLLSDEEKIKLDQVKKKQNKKRMKLEIKCDKAKATLGEWRNKNSDIIQAYEGTQKDLHLVKQLGDSVIPLKQHLEMLLEELGNSPAIKDYLGLQKKFEDDERDLKLHNDKAVEEYEVQRDRICVSKCDALQLIPATDDYKYILSRQGFTAMLYLGGFLK